MIDRRIEQSTIFAALAETWERSFLEIASKYCDRNRARSLHCLCPVTRFQILWLVEPAALIVGYIQR